LMGDESYRAKRTQEGVLYNLYFTILRCCVTSECPIGYAWVSQLFVRKYSKYVIDIIAVVSTSDRIIFLCGVIDLLFLVRHVLRLNTVTTDVIIMCTCIIIIILYTYCITSLEYITVAHEQTDVKTH